MADNWKFFFYPENQLLKSFVCHTAKLTKINENIIRRDVWICFVQGNELSNQILMDRTPKLQCSKEKKNLQRKSFINHKYVEASKRYVFSLKFEL